MKGKKSGFTGNDFLRYLARERLQLTEKVRDSITEELKAAIPVWEDMIEKSFLPPEKKEKYRNIVEERAGRLFG